jgi:hypothetical protein
MAALIEMGPPTNRVAQPDEEKGILKVRHVASHGLGSDGFLEPQGLQPFGSSPLNAIRLESGDVVMTTRGAVFGAGIIPEHLEGLELGAGLAVVRLKPAALSGLTPRLLRAHLLTVAWDDALHHERGPQGQLALRLKTLRSLPIRTLTQEATARLDELLGATEAFRHAAMAALQIREQVAVGEVRHWLGERE